MISAFLPFCAKNEQLGKMQIYQLLRIYSGGLVNELFHICLKRTKTPCAVHKNDSEYRLTADSQPLSNRHRAWIAWPRWLRRFFSSAGSSAAVSRVAGSSNTGS